MTGAELRSIRLALGLSQLGFGEALGVSQSYVDLMESGAVPVERRTSLAACFLSLSIDSRAVPPASRPPESELPDTMRPVPLCPQLEQLVASRRKA